MTYQSLSRSRENILVRHLHKSDMARTVQMDRLILDISSAAAELDALAEETEGLGEEPDATEQDALEEAGDIEEDEPFAEAAGEPLDEPDAEPAMLERDLEPETIEAPVPLQ
jgi:hypothetical protein